MGGQTSDKLSVVNFHARLSVAAAAWMFAFYVFEHFYSKMLGKWEVRRKCLELCGWVSLGKEECRFENLEWKRQSEKSCFWNKPTLTEREEMNVIKSFWYDKTPQKSHLIELQEMSGPLWDPTAHQ